MLGHGWLPGLPSSALLLAGASALSACSGSSDPALRVAAASLRKAFTRYGQAFDGGRVDYSFAGSDELAAQIADAALRDRQRRRHQRRSAGAQGQERQAGQQPAREVWVQETALSTALNASYMANQVSLFGVVVGIALLLSGLGFAILAVGGALRNPDSVFRTLAAHRPHRGHGAAPSPTGA